MKKNKKVSVEEEKKEMNFSEETNSKKESSENKVKKEDEKQEEKKKDEKEDPLKDLQAKYDELNDKYLRNVAEFDNYRKRSLSEKAELIKNGGEKILCGVIEILDDIERGVNAAKDAKDIESVKSGLDHIYNKFNQFLEQNGIEEIKTNGEDFNTDMHEAIAMVPAQADEQKGKVIDCVQKGYFLNGKVIRFAKVAVGK